MKDKTILIALNHGISVRNILQTDIFRILQKSGIKIVILTPNAENESFRRMYKSDNVYFEKLNWDKYDAYFRRSRLQPRLKCVRWFTLNGRYDLTTISDWYEKVHKKQRNSSTARHKIVNLVEDSLIRLLRSSSILRKIFIRLESLFFSPPYHRDIFLRHKPDWVLVTSLGFFDYDQYIMREAKKHGAKLISYILSWDNTSTRGIGAEFPDEVIAWTDIMKKELIQLHDIKPEKIFVGGVAHYDHYYHRESIYERRDFLSRFNLSEGRKLIFFATKSPTGFPWNPDIVEIIAEAIQNDVFAYPCQLLIRLHPIHFRRAGGELRFKDFFDRYDKISRRYKHVSFNIPHIRSKEIAFDLPKSELYDVASLLHYSDVMLNVFSTMNLEASIFDTPIINVCFEGERAGQYGNTPRVNINIDEMQTHNQRIVKTGGIRLARSKRELVDLINMYLKNPEMDMEGRAKIVRDECGPNQGRAGFIIGKHISKLLGSETGVGEINADGLPVRKEERCADAFNKR
ncbi:MAG: hypothetical protein ISS26_01525 [Candidatus Omnitrophica bacterium]|nr:hypothetical protein [Candidatus Omnitrophota bacterium]